MVSGKSAVHPVTTPLTATVDERRTQLMATVYGQRTQLTVDDDDTDDGDSRRNGRNDEEHEIRNAKLILFTVDDKQPVARTTETTMNECSERTKRLLQRQNRTKKLPQNTREQKSFDETKRPSLAHALLYSSGACGWPLLLTAMGWDGVRWEFALRKSGIYAIYWSAGPKL